MYQNPPPLSFAAPLPRRGAVGVLRQALIDYLDHHRPGVGTPLYSDAELARLARVSRSTVRRALDELQREGWIERRQGLGTFVGPRVGLPMPTRPRAGGNLRGLVRAAVMLFRFGAVRPNWFEQLMLAGLDEGAAEHGLSLELLGADEADPYAVGDRLTRNRPDVLVCMEPKDRHFIALAEAKRLGIPCLCTGGVAEVLNVPAVTADQRQGGELATAHLLEQGHRRIGWISLDVGEFALAERLRGHRRALRAAGAQPDRNLELLLEAQRYPDEPGDQGYADVLVDYLQRHRPSAVVVGSGPRTEALGVALKRLGWRVPGDLSVVVFDQRHEHERWLDGARPTHVVIPVRAMGRYLASIVRPVLAGQPVAGQHRIACSLGQGQSVAPHVHAAGSESTSQITSTTRRDITSP